MDDTYIRILENIDDIYCRHVYDILTLIAFSMWPLRLAEIIEVIAFDVEGKCFSEDEKLMGPLDVFKICSSLISLPDTRLIEETDSSEREFNPSEQEVRFAYFSVKEFLIADRSMNNRFHISKQSANELIGEQCVIYLRSNLNFIDPLIWNLIGRYRFLRYSARYWYTHIDTFLLDASHKELKDLILQLFDSIIFSNWLRIWDQDNHREMADDL